MDAAIVAVVEEGSISMTEAAMGEKAPISMVEPCSKKSKDDAYTESKAAAGKVADFVAMAGAFGLVQAEKQGMWIIPGEEVQFFLKLKIHEMPPDLRDEILEKQAWYRRQYDANNGVVLLDDEMAAAWVARVKEMREVEEEVLQEIKEINLKEANSQKVKEDEASRVI